MNHLLKAVLAQACPTCGAGPGESCRHGPPLGQLNTWHRARYLLRVTKRIRPPRTDSLRLGANPCSRCAKHAHTQCAGCHHPNHGQPGQLCTCECAIRRRREQKR